MRRNRDARNSIASTRSASSRNPFESLLTLSKWLVTIFASRCKLIIFSFRAYSDGCATFGPLEPRTTLLTHDCLSRFGSATCRIEALGQQVSDCAKMPTFQSTQLAGTI